MSDDEKDSGLLGLGAGAAAGAGTAYFAHDHLSNDLAQMARNGGATQTLNSVALKAMSAEEVAAKNRAAIALRQGNLGEISKIDITKAADAKAHTVRFTGTNNQQASLQVKHLGEAEKHVKEGSASITAAADLEKLTQPEKGGKWVQKVTANAERELNTTLRGTESWKKATGFGGIKGLGAGKVALITAATLGSAVVAKKGFDMMFGSYSDRVASERYSSGHSR